MQGIIKTMLLIMTIECNCGFLKGSHDAFFFDLSHESSGIINYLCLFFAKNISDTVCHDHKLKKNI